MSKSARTGTRRSCGAIDGATGRGCGPWLGIDGAWNERHLFLVGFALPRFQCGSLRLSFHDPAECQSREIRSSR